MKNFFMIAALTGWVAGAQEPTVKTTTQSGPSIEFQKDPPQTRTEPTTQIISTNGIGTAPVGQVGSNSVDDDLRQRILVALSTGSIGTQGVLPADQLTDIKVAVTNRQATLRGDVISAKNKANIGKRIAKLDGVRGVNNQLTVNPKAKRARADLLQPDGYSAGQSKQK